MAQPQRKSQKVDVSERDSISTSGDSGSRKIAKAWLIVATIAFFVFLGALAVTFRQ